jgi:hypothetical protein
MSRRPSGLRIAGAAAVFAASLFSAFMEIQAQVVISEFLARSETGIRDADGELSDWIEVWNQGAAAVDLSGWHLTDAPSLLEKWRIGDSPEHRLAPGAYRLIFASGKNRDTGAELHANFSLAADGEYLALVLPDGTTIAHEFTPRFPPQRTDISYGLTTRADLLVEAGAAARYLVPVDGAEGAAWTQAEYQAGPAWRDATIGLGYSSDGAAPQAPAPSSLWALDGSLAGAGAGAATFAGGATVYVEDHEGRPGGALRFDGVDDSARLPTGGALPGYSRPAFTVALWVRGSPQSDKRVYSEGSSSNNTPLFTLGTDAGGGSGRVDVFVRFAGGAGPGHRLSDGVAFDGAWHHIAWVDSGGDAALYIDGARDAVDFSYAKEAMALDRVSIGSVLRASACCFFDGDIAEAAVWDRALSPEEVEAAAGASFGGSPLDRWIDTDVAEAMDAKGSSIFVRVPFVAGDPSLYDFLRLNVRYDDGFVAYLNGVEVARRNAPAALAWNAAATLDRPADANANAEAIDLSDRLGLVRAGANVLAIHGLNRAAGDGDFLLLPELIASSSTASDARHFRPPTPGGPNASGFVDFVADTRFSVDRGFFEAPFDVAITCETPGAEIRYTTDGSAPSATRGSVYAGPIRIATTTTLRAAAFKADFQPSNVDTQTYLFLDDVIRQRRPAAYPTTWAGLTADYDMDPEVATNAASPAYQPTLRDDLKAIPTMSLTMSLDDFMGPTRGIYTHPEQRGDAWERPASVEFFTADGSRTPFQVDCAVILQGGSSARPIEGKHSFRLIFKDEFGPTKLRYPFFEDSEVESFDTLVLRCFSTDSWHFKDGGGRYRRWDSQYIRDLFMKDSQLAMGQLSGHNTYVHLYVNGLYWGLYNPSERPDDNFNAAHQGGEPEDWDVVKDFTELFRGTLAAWNQMMTLASAGLGTIAAYERIQGNNPDGTPNPAYPVHLDVDNLIDYMALHLYYCAEDWPHHNWYAARNRTGLTGGWRFFVWDQEIGMDFAYRDRLDVSNTGSPAFLYARLRDNAEFRLRFADHVQRHFFNGGALTVAEARRRWMRRAAEIDRAIVGESARWGDFRDDVPDPTNSPAELYTRERHWLPEQAKVVNQYIPESHRLALERFRREGLFPALAAPAFNQHGGDIEPGFQLTMTAAAGEILYTLDGSDPRSPGGASSPAAQSFGIAGVEVLVPSGAASRSLVPADGALGLAWTAPDFDDSAWIGGATGVGFERTSGFEDLLGTDLIAQMDGINATVYLRVAFDVDDPAALDVLTLKMKYDDGFIAYLNGVEAARRNAPATPLWNSSASTAHSDADAVVFEPIDITAQLVALRPGRNVLAIHGMNAGAASSDMLILPELAAAAAAAGGGGVTFRESVRVKARARDGAEWSPLAEAVFAVDNGLRVTEIMYHPAADPEGLIDRDEFEFIELQNVGARTVDLRGVRFTGGVAFDFGAGAVTSLAPGRIVLVVENQAAFSLRYGVQGFAIAGEYAGKLNNAGEPIELRGPLDEVLQSFTFADAWHAETDGAGPSLVIDDPLAPKEAWSTPQAWRPSRSALGSPGVDESGIQPPGGLVLPGDANVDGDLNVSDGVRVLIVLFVDPELPLPCEADFAAPGNRTLLDANGDGAVNLADAVRVLNYLFNGGPAHVLGIGCARIEGCPESCR